MLYRQWFSQVTGFSPFSWQEELASDPACGSRLIRIPTGFGKTAGVVLAWAWNAIVREDSTWPRRLVFCLPMRVLVEQTEDAVTQWLDRCGLLWDGRDRHEAKVGVHIMMGGRHSTDWHLHPEAGAVLIGTQDMLLSRALNRGFGSHRPRWPVDFGLLNQDALWVMDEVQLMDVGLATGAQLQAFRDEDAPRGLRPCHTWWMSATLQPSWLRSVDTGSMVDQLPRTTIDATRRRGHLWDDVSKRCSLEGLKAPGDDGALADLVTRRFREHARGRLTLVVVNTVERACSVHKHLTRMLAEDLPTQHLHLVHSRFRPVDRRAWLHGFLSRHATVPPAGRLIVATQVVEAGIDVDAGLLVTELAPWPSLVQRFGRAARGGGAAHIVVVDRVPRDDKQAAPYTCAEIAASRQVLQRLDDVSPLGLERFEGGLSPEALADLYPYQPRHLLLRHEWNELFDTTPDLTGGDVDISRFIRSGDERDVLVFWADVSKGTVPSPDIQPTREAICAVPFLRARDWLCVAKKERLAPGKLAWTWDWLDGRWRPCRRSAILPGRILLVTASSGGYDPARGWDPGAPGPVDVVPTATGSPEQAAEAASDTEVLSANPWKTIACHGAEVSAEADSIARAVGFPPSAVRVLALAGRWHDLGKAHPAFQGSIRSPERPDRPDIAKAPQGAWGRAFLYRSTDDDHRPGFRHELASALALYAVLVRHRPDHEALLGPHLDMLRACGFEPRVVPGQTAPPVAVEEDLLALSRDDFDLVAYLVACHHGKVRGSLHAAPADQDYSDRDGRGLPVRGVRDGDVLPETVIQGSSAPLPASTLSLEPAVAGLSVLTGASWAERCLGLLARHGPGALGLLEACLRAADVRASQMDTPDPLLSTEGQP